MKSNIRCVVRKFEHIWELKTMCISRLYKPYCIYEAAYIDRTQAGCVLFHNILMNDWPVWGGGAGGGGYEK